MTWIQTRNNLKFDLLNPRASMVDPEVIATVLARTPRFGGHDILPVDRFYNNAQHSLLVCEIVEMEVKGIKSDDDLVSLPLPALLHDAHEVYSGFGDVLNPAKRLNEETSRFIDVHEGTVNLAVCERFGIHNIFSHPIIKHADLVALATEQRDVMGPPPEPWCEMPPPMQRRIVPMTIKQAKNAFMRKLYELWSGD